MKEGTHITRFTYLKNTQTYDFLRPIKLMDLEAKHITAPDSSKAQDVLERAERAGHAWCIFGSHRDNPSLYKEIGIIDRMAADTAFNRPLRVVITMDGRIWSDNNHTTLAYIQRSGEGVALHEVPFYVVDFRPDVPTIISFGDTVEGSLSDVKNAIASAERLNLRLLDGYRPPYLSWCIADLAQQLSDPRVRAVPVPNLDHLS